MPDDNQPQEDAPEEILARSVTFKKVVDMSREETSGPCESIIVILSWVICIIPIFWFFMFRTVTDYQRALIFRLGKLVDGPPRGPGLFILNPLTDTIKIVDLRI